MCLSKGEVVLTSRKSCHNNRSGTLHRIKLNPDNGGSVEGSTHLARAYVYSLGLLFRLQSHFRTPKVYLRGFHIHLCPSHGLATLSKPPFSASHS